MSCASRSQSHTRLALHKHDDHNHKAAVSSTRLSIFENHLCSNSSTSTFETETRICTEDRRYHTTETSRPPALPHLRPTHACSTNLCDPLLSSPLYTTHPPLDGRQIQHDPTLPVSRSLLRRPLECRKVKSVERSLRPSERKDRKSELKSRTYKNSQCIRRGRSKQRYRCQRTLEAIIFWRISRGRHTRLRLPLPSRMGT